MPFSARFLASFEGMDQLQTYIATRVEYFGDLTNYWTAVYQLEEAAATELHR